MLERMELSFDKANVFHDGQVSGADMGTDATLDTGLGADVGGEAVLAGFGQVEESGGINLGGAGVEAPAAADTSLRFMVVEGADDGVGLAGEVDNGMVGICG